MYRTVHSSRIARVVRLNECSRRMWLERRLVIKGSRVHVRQTISPRRHGEHGESESWFFSFHVQGRPTWVRMPRTNFKVFPPCSLCLRGETGPRLHPISHTFHRKLLRNSYVREPRRAGNVQG